jgi:hypothetical protein
MLLHLTLGIDEEISPTAELAARAIAETARALGNLSSAELTGLFQPFKDVPGW